MTHTHIHNQSQLHSDGVVAFSLWHQTLQRMSMAAPPFNSFPPWTILCKGCYDMTSSPNRSILHPSPCMKKQKVLQTAPGLERQQETSLAANIRITWHHANDFPKHWRHLTLQQFRSEPLMSHQAIMQLQQSPLSPRFSWFLVCVAVEQPNHMAIDTLAHIAHGLRSGHPRLQRRSTGRCRKRTGHHAQRPGEFRSKETPNDTNNKGQWCLQSAEENIRKQYVAVFAMHACDRMCSSGRIVFYWLNNLI
jgi:hypothetical protein